MLNKKGLSGSDFAPGLIIGGIIALFIISTIVVYSYNDEEIFSLSDIAEKAQRDNVGFETALGSAFKPLDYIFGPIPGYLYEITGNYSSAAIVVIAMWVMFLLLFGDILRLFGPFSQVVNLLIALLLVIIGANVKLISTITVYSLAFLSVFGALSVILSIAFVFLLFLLFHFGGTGIRSWIILRRAQDSAMQAVAGGKIAASGIDVLSSIVKKAQDAKKKNDGML